MRRAKQATDCEFGNRTHQVALGRRKFAFHLMALEETLAEPAIGLGTNKLFYFAVRAVG